MRAARAFETANTTAAFDEDLWTFMPYFNLSSNPNVTTLEQIKAVFK